MDDDSKDGFNPDFYQFFYYDKYDSSFKITFNPFSIIDNSQNRACQNEWDDQKLSTVIPFDESTNIHFQVPSLPVNQVAQGILILRGKKFRALFFQALLNGLKRKKIGQQIINKMHMDFFSKHLPSDSKVVTMHSYHNNKLQYFIDFWPYMELILSLIQRNLHYLRSEFLFK